MLLLINLNLNCYIWYHPNKKKVGVRVIRLFQLFLGFIINTQTFKKKALERQHQ
jgi:hypothetical protein